MLECAENPLRTIDTSVGVLRHHVLEITEHFDVARHTSRLHSLLHMRVREGLLERCAVAAADLGSAELGTLCHEALQGRRRLSSCGLGRHVAQKLFSYV